MTDPARSEPLRVAVLVESFVVPEWVAWTIARIDSSDAFELTSVVPAAVAGCPHAPARSPRSARELAYRLYEWLDRTVFGAGRAMRATDLSQRLTTIADIGALDVVVSFLPAERTGWRGPSPCHGVWAIAPMDDGRPASAASRFWEVRGRSGTAGSAVVAVGGGLPRVIAESSTTADPLSLTRTRDAAAWASARLVLRCLRSLHRDGRSFPVMRTLAEQPPLPSTAVIARHAARTAVRGIKARSHRAWRRDEWFVAVRRRAADGRSEPVHALANPAGRYLADPFPIDVGGRHYLFVEDYSYATRRGSISVSEARSDGGWSPPRRVLERDHHLSYPFVFEHDGAIFMVPETGEAGRIELHRATEFPHRWRLERVLLDGLTAVDASLHIEKGLVWLFANILDGHGDRGELSLFFASSLSGEWHPHPHNPIVTDPARARPAGRLFRRGGQLIRPSQDCTRAYGEAVVLNRVDVLSPHEYCETPVGRIEPTWLSGVERTHTYTLDSRYECMDGYRHVRRLRIPRARGIDAARP